MQFIGSAGDLGINKSLMCCGNASAGFHWFSVKFLMEFIGADDDMCVNDLECNEYVEYLR